MLTDIHRAALALSDEPMHTPARPSRSVQKVDDAHRNLVFLSDLVKELGNLLLLLAAHRLVHADLCSSMARHIGGRVTSRVTRRRNGKHTL